MPMPIMANVGFSPGARTRGALTASAFDVVQAVMTDAAALPKRKFFLLSFIVDAPFV